MISRKAIRLSRKDASRDGPACRTASTIIREALGGLTGSNRTWAPESNTPAILTVAVAAVFFAIPAASQERVTFYRDVLPIFQTHCQGCHRAGEMAPMPLETYRQTRPFASAIKDATAKRIMPPWFADPCCGHFSYDPSLSG